MFKRRKTRHCLSLLDTRGCRHAVALIRAQNAIIPRTSGALGYTMQIDEGERSLYSRDLENRIATFTGGRAAEEVYL